MYAPYVLIRCAAFTDSWRLSQEIGAYVLLCTCLLATRMSRRVRVGILVEAMLEVVGPDVASRDDGRAAPVFFTDAGMRRIAGTLNRMKRPLREALVLGAVGGRSTRELARLLHKSVDEVRANFERAQTALAEELGVGIASVRTLLADFAAGLDADWIEQVTGCALEYLIAELDPAGAPPRCWMN